MTDTAIPSKAQDTERFQADIFNHICFMLVSARGCVEEPHLYGPFRLVDTVSRLVELLDQHGLATPFFRDLHQHIEATKFSLINDTDAFVRSIDEAVLMAARQEVGKTAGA